jgi:transcriptional regulator with XRE-family HTH domain
VPETLTRARGRPRGGVISGYVLRMIREQTGYTQAALAERLQVSEDALSAWESGRRPFVAMSIAHVITYRHQLLQLGADPRWFTVLDRAAEADMILASVLAPEQVQGKHPLGAWVMQRDIVETVVWPITHIVPRSVQALPGPAVPRRGPVPAGPVLAADERDRFFGNLRRLVEDATQPEGFLLYRQALYLSGYDTTEARDWLCDHQQCRAIPNDWLRRWLSQRSIASVATRWGDKGRLSHFVTALVGDDRGEAANLNYWAYWVGETDIELSDDFMASGRLGAWNGKALLSHLVERLTPDHDYLELNVHTIWALLTTRPQLLREPAVRAALRDRLEALLDHRTDATTGRVTQEANQVRYAVHMAEAQGRADT